MFEQIVHNVMLAYLYGTIGFLILRISNKECKLRTNDFLNLSSVIILVFSLLNLINAFISFNNCFSDEDKLLTSNRLCYLHLFSCFAFALVFQLLFFSKKYRTKIWAVIISLACIFIYFNFNNIAELLTAQYIDMTPNSLSIKEKATLYLPIILYSTIFFAFCFWLSISKKKIMD
jgi:hypothetical protein